MSHEKYTCHFNRDINFMDENSCFVKIYPPQKYKCFPWNRQTGILTNASDTGPASAQFQQCVGGAMEETCLPTDRSR